LPLTPAQVALADVEPVLDRAAFDAFAEDIGLDGVRETLDVYLADTVERLALLRRLSCDMDRAKIKVEAHTLKGSSSTFGLTQLVTLARTLEHAAHEISPADWGDLLDPDRCGLRGGTSRSRRRDVRAGCERGLSGAIAPCGSSLQVLS
jgi:HPt (histidine-containing phosphotransfer) domain-containing protein